MKRHSLLGQGALVEGEELVVAVGGDDHLQGARVHPFTHHQLDGVGCEGHHPRVVAGADGGAACQTAFHRATTTTACRQE